MKINRKNYEVFFIDYFDGKLTAEQVTELMLFISQNHDLAEEFHCYEEVNLPVQQVEFQEKNSLKNITNQSFIISENTFDTYCIAYIEGDLNQTEKKYFEKYLLNNPEKFREYKIFTKSILKPEPEIIFENKISLKRFEITKNYKRVLIAGISVAASVIIIFFLYFISSTTTELQPEYAIIKSTSIKDIADTIDKSEQKIIPEKQKKQNHGNLQNENFNIINKNNTTIADNKTITDKDSSIHENNNKIKKEIFNDKIEHLENKKLTSLNVALPVHNDITINYVNYKKPKKKSEPKTLAQILKTKIQKAIKGDNAEQNHKFGFIDVADALVRGVNKITGKKMKLQKTYDSKGDVETLAFYSENLQIYKGGKK